MSNDKAQITNEAQSSNYKGEMVLQFRYSSFVCHLDFGIWDLFVIWILTFGFV
jgi:hypothetical protein